MGCFSFLSVKSGDAAVSTSFDGSPCWLFRLFDGKVAEYMHGNYDSYGRVFDGKGGSFTWKMDGLETAMLLEDEWKEGDPFPTEPSESDPDQGWGMDWRYLQDTSRGVFQQVENPKHVIFEDVLNEAKLGEYTRKIEWAKEMKEELQKRAERIKNKYPHQTETLSYIEGVIAECYEETEALETEKEEFIKSKNYV